MTAFSSPEVPPRSTIPEPLRRGGSKPAFASAPDASYLWILPLGNVQVNLTLPSLIRTFAAQFATTYDFNRRPHRRVQRHDAFQRHLLHDRRQGPDRPDGQKRSGQIDPAEDHRRSAFGHAGARDRGRRRESGVSAPAPSGGGRAHARRGGVAGLRTPVRNRAADRGAQRAAHDPHRLRKRVVHAADRGGHGHLREVLCRGPHQLPGRRGAHSAGAGLRTERLHAPDLRILGRLAHAHRAGQAAVAETRPAALGRADEPPRHRVDRVAGGFPDEQRQGRNGHFPRQGFRGPHHHAHHRDRPRTHLRLQGQLLPLPRTPQGSVASSSRRPTTTSRR